MGKQVRSTFEQESFLVAKRAQEAWNFIFRHLMKSSVSKSGHCPTPLKNNNYKLNELTLFFKGWHIWKQKPHFLLAMGIIYIMYRNVIKNYFCNYCLSQWSSVFFCGITEQKEYSYF